MSRPFARLALIAVVLLAPGLGGCTYDYLQHTDRLAYSGGDAVKANLEAETVNPSKRSMYSKDGLGRNGLIIPEPTTGSSSTGSSTTMKSSPTTTTTSGG